MSDDLESFIQSQKNKLAAERDQLAQAERSPRNATSVAHQNGVNDSGRKKWDAPTQPSVMKRAETPENGGALPLGGNMDQRKKRLQEERKKEYNELISKPAAGKYKAPPTPVGGGRLALGGEKKKEEKNELARQRYKEYNDLLSKAPPARKKPRSPEENDHLHFDAYDYEQKRKEEGKKLSEEYQTILAHSEEQRHRSKMRAPYEEENLKFDAYDYELKRKEEGKKLREEYEAVLAQKERERKAKNKNVAIEDDKEEFKFDSYKLEDKRKASMKERQQEYIKLQKTHAGLSRRGGYNGEEQDAMTFGVTGERKRKQLNEERKQEYAQQQMEQGVGARQGGYKENIPPPSPDEVGFIGQLGQYENRRRKLQEERHQEYNKQQHKQPGISALDAAASEAHPLGNSPSVIPHTGPPPMMPRAPPVAQYPVTPTPAPAAAAGHVGEMTEKEMYLEYLRKKSEKVAQNIRAMSAHAGLETSAPAGVNARSQRRERELDLDEEFVRTGPKRGWATPTYDSILEKKREEERAYRRGDDPGMALGGQSYARSSRSDGHLNNEPVDPRWQDQDAQYEAKKVRFRMNNDMKTEPPPLGIPSLLDDPNWLAPHPQELDLALHLNRSRSKPEFSNGPPPPAPAQRSRRSEPFPNSSNNNQYQATLLFGGQQRMSADQRKKAQYRDELQKQMEETKRNKQREKAEDMRVAITGAADIARGAPPPQSQRSNLRGNNPIVPSDDTYSRPPPPRARSQQALEPQADGFSPRSILFDDQLGRAAAIGGGGGILERGFDSLYAPPPKAPAILKPSVGGYQQSNEADQLYNYYATRNPLDPNIGTPGVSIPPGGVGLAAPSSGPPPSYLYPTRQPEQQQQQQQAARQVQFDSTPRGPTNPYQSPGQQYHQQQQPVGMAEFPSDDQRKGGKEDAKKTYQRELQRQIEEDKAKKEQSKRDKEAYDRKLEEDIRNYDPFGRGGGGAPLKDPKGNLIANRNPNNPANLSQMHEENKGNRPREVAPPPSVQDPYSSPRKPPTDGESFSRGGHGIFGEALTDAQKQTKDKYQEELKQQIEEKKRQAAEEKEKQRLEDEKAERRVIEEQRKMAEEKEQEERNKREKALKDEAERQEKLQADEAKRRAEKEKREREDEEERRRDRVEAARTAAPASRNKSPPLPTMANKGAVSRPPSGKSTLHRENSGEVFDQLTKMRQELNKQRKQVEADLIKEQQQPEVYDTRLAGKVLPSTNVDVFARAGRSKQRLDDPTSPDDFREFRQLKQGHHNGAQPQQRVGAIRPDSVTSAALLDASTDFIAVPDDELTFPNTSQNNSARQRRRQRSPTPSIGYAPSIGTSLSSLDPDAIERKNEQRARNLKSMAGDNISTSDASEIVDTFMNQQRHKRPASGLTLRDDTWLNASGARA